MVNYDKFIKGEVKEKQRSLISLYMKRREEYLDYKRAVKDGYQNDRLEQCKRDVIRAHEAILRRRGKFVDPIAVKSEKPETPYVKYDFMSYSDQNGYEMHGTYSEAKERVYIWDTYMYRWIGVAYKWTETGWVELNRSGNFKPKQRVSENDLNG